VFGSTADPQVTLIAEAIGSVLDDLASGVSVERAKASALARFPSSDQDLRKDVQHVLELLLRLRECGKKLGKRSARGQRRCVSNQ
jgi:hypothetical protein